MYKEHPPPPTLVPYQDCQSEFQSGEAMHHHLMSVANSHTS